MPMQMARDFFARDTVAVARDLLGKVLIVGQGQNRRAGLIVETEAYRQDDPASHSFNGPSARNQSMFGPPGHLYVYLIYGVHHCANIVTESPGTGAAVLLRGIQPLQGVELMQRARGRQTLDGLCDGPGKLCQALAIDRSWDGVDLCLSKKIAIEDWGHGGGSIKATPRIGISKARRRLWRFVRAG